MPIGPEEGEAHQQDGEEDGDGLGHEVATEKEEEEEMVCKPCPEGTEGPEEGRQPMWKRIPQRVSQREREEHM